MDGYASSLTSFYGRDGNAKMAMGGKGPGAFIDCCAQNPENYKVAVENAGMRLVEMKLPAGAADKPHDHPPHYMYIVNGAKLKLNPLPGATEEGEIELPTGAAVCLPPGTHQVTNIGETEAHFLFMEPLLSCAPCDVPGYKDPVECTTGYKNVAEDDQYKVVTIDMPVGFQDDPHAHRDHLVYILEGDGITIFPGETPGDAKMEIPIKPGMALPVPSGFHSVKNTGTVPVKIVYFEQKF